MTAKKSHTIETTTSIDTTKLKEKMKRAAMTFIGATDYTDGLYIPLNSSGFVWDFDNAEDSKHKHNGIYLMAEHLKSTSDAEIAFIRNNFDVRPFNHHYSSGRNSYHLSIESKDIERANDGDFAAMVREQGLAISTGNTIRPANTALLESARKGVKFANKCFIGAWTSGAGSVALGIAGVFGSMAFSAIAFPLAGYCLAAAAVGAVVGGISHLACRTNRIREAYESANSDPLKDFMQKLDEKFDGSAPAVAPAVAAKPARKTSTRAKKISIVANDVFEKPEVIAEAAPAAPAKTSKREIKL